MKKVRMILSATAIFAVVGGALAFTGSKDSGTLLCRTTSGTCPSDHTYRQTSPGTTMFCNVNGGTNCNVQTTVTLDDN